MTEDLVLDQDQVAAVALLTTASTGVITGPPGVGKTTCIRAALDQLDGLQQSYQLCAPTGKAAKRMSEATGRPAKTIHRMLEWSRGGFLRNHGNPLDAMLVVCDESSMLDLLLSSDLTDAIPPTTRIVFVGDANQLPPIGPGMFFRDLIASERVPVVSLQTLHRAAAASWICRNAPRVLAGRGVEMNDCDDFEWHQGPNGNLEAVTQAVGDIVQRLIAEGVSPDDFQVLSPMKIRGGGTHELNRVLQPLCLQLSKVAQDAGRRSRRVGWGEDAQEIHVGDRVIQTRNNYELGVFNGDVGEVVNMGPRALTVRFGDEHRAYNEQQMNDLQLAYALTVHKFQGSEVQDAIVVCHSAHGSMLNRQLIYTALTRARRRVFLVGDEQGWRMALGRNQVQQRRTRLLDRLRGEV